MKQKQVVTLAIIILFQCNALQKSIAQSSDDVSVIQQRYSIDPNASLETRIGEASADVLTMFRNAGMAPVQHQLSEEERNIVLNVMENLPSVHQEMLRKHLRCISFLDEMPNTALTSTLNPEDDFKVFDLTIRAAILKQTVSEWLTEKEYTCFDTTDSNIRLLINGGKLNALQYVLLHEATHIVDGSLEVTPSDRVYSNESIPDSLSNPFIKGVWSKRSELHPSYQDAVLNNIAFRRGGQKMPISEAVNVYKRLSKTPFTSLYSLSSWHEDLAECTTILYVTKRLKQPFQILVYRDDKKIFKYEPMKSKIVRNRLDVPKALLSS